MATKFVEDIWNPQRPGKYGAHGGAVNILFNSQNERLTRFSLTQVAFGVNRGMNTSSGL